jgi:hypothetical protein
MIVNVCVCVCVSFFFFFFFFSSHPLHPFHHLPFFDFKIFPPLFFLFFFIFIPKNHEGEKREEGENFPWNFHDFQCFVCVSPLNSSFLISKFFSSFLLFFYFYS